jgi:hypothetical protein
MFSPLHVGVLAFLVLGGCRGLGAGRLAGGLVVQELVVGGSGHVPRVLPASRRPQERARTSGGRHAPVRLDQGESSGRRTAIVVIQLDHHGPGPAARIYAMHKLEFN